MNIQYIHPADQIVMFMQRIYDKRLTTMSGGNLSIRDSEGNIWITPAGIDKGTLSRKDIICVRPDGVCEGQHIWRRTIWFASRAMPKRQENCRPVLSGRSLRRTA